MSSKDANADIKVELYLDDKLIETQPAKVLRPDLAGKFGSGKYGFSFKMPAEYKDGKPHTAKVKVAGSDHDIPFLQANPSFVCSV